MHFWFGRTLLSALTFFALSACGTSQNSGGTESSGGVDDAKVAAAGNDLFDLSRQAAIGVAFSGLSPGTTALKTIANPQDDCPASIRGSESCQGGGAFEVDATCSPAEDGSFVWTGRVTFRDCGPSLVDGPVSFVLTLGPPPDGCTPLSCLEAVPLILTVDGSSAEGLSAIGKLVDMNGLFDGPFYGHLALLVLRRADFRMGDFSCRLSAGPDSSFVCDPDADGDKIEDSSDNCPADFNPSQADTDGDGLGDLCDDNVTGESPEELACSEKVGVTACLSENDGDCCEGQFCNASGVCDTCSELVSVEGLSCRPGHPNDCCGGQFCNVNSQCFGCPPEGGVTACFSEGDSCTTDDECRTRAANGEFDTFLLAGGILPPAPSLYTCGLPGTEGDLSVSCCVTAPDVVAECQGASPPHDQPSCDFVACGEGNTCPDTLECHDGCCFPIQACETFACETDSDCSAGPREAPPPDAMACIDGCCQVSSGGGGTDYCPSDCSAIPIGGTPPYEGTCDNGTAFFGGPFFGANTFCMTPTDSPCPSLAGAPAGFYCGSSNLSDGTTPDQICQATGAPGVLSCLEGCCISSSPPPPPP